MLWQNTEKHCFLSPCNVLFSLLHNTAPHENAALKTYSLKKFIFGGDGGATIAAVSRVTRCKSVTAVCALKHKGP